MEETMDIKEILLNIIQSENSRYSNMALEKLILVMLQDYAKGQGKEAFIEGAFGLCDMIFPNGIDDIAEKVSVPKNIKEGELMSKTIRIADLFEIKQGNIADEKLLKQYKIDTIVNAANPTLMGSTQGVVQSMPQLKN